MSTRQLQQVAYTYLLRPNEWGWMLGILYIALAIMAVGMIVDDEPPEARHTFDLVFPLALLAITPPTVIRRHALAWQFNHPRAALTPGFFAPHTAIVAAVAIPCMLLVPLAIASATATSMWFCLAVTAVGVLVTGESMLILLLCWPLFFGGRYIEQYVAAHPWMMAEGFRGSILVAVAIGSWLLILRGFLRDATGREEGPRIAPAAWSGTDDRSARPFRAAKQVVADAQSSGWGQALASRQTDRAIARAQRLRGRKWRKLSLAMFSPLASAPFLCAAIFLGVIVPSRFTPWQLDQDYWEDLVGMLPMLSLIAAMLSAALANRLPQMSFERLLPMSNSEYAAAQILVPARLGIRIWLIAHALALLATFALPWQDFTPPSIATLAMYVAISWAGMTLTFGATACCLLAPNILTVLLTAIVGMAAMFGLPSYWQSLSPSSTRVPLAVAASLCVLIGAFLIQHAYAGWRDKELG